ncbi:pseudouridine synthase [uncultured Maribacter sp.]|uniref:pseudouridine synthase n=1 Tax=uncultured Maribacter sp. TaxID=431308 RepID=UPI002602A544|nr:pseudouridine synthase [uncultured Maribacter sp.]
MAEHKDITYKIYKPYGMLSQFRSNDAKESRKKRFLGELYKFPKGIMPVGRLDEKSEGLLLLTGNGKWSDAINRSGIEKEYFAQLDGEISEEAIEKLKEGIEIGFSGKKYTTKPCFVKRVLHEPDFETPNTAIRLGRHRPNSWISITITEGKFRQVRKMTAAVGFPTLRLIRVRIGDVHLEQMKPGEVALVKKSALLTIHSSTKENP